MTRPSPCPRVSVICAFLDAERFIGETLDSLFAQDFADFEAIFVDDGSSDDSAEIVARHAALHPGKVRILSHPGHENRGISASRNLGLAHAGGDYIAFLDADDVWTPTKLSEQVALMDANPSLGMLCGVVLYWRSWNGGEDELIPTGGLADVELAPGQAVSRLHPVGSGAAPGPSEVMLRRSAVEAVGGCEDAFRDMFEDQVLFSKVMLQFPVLFADRLWVWYRVRDDSCMAVSIARHGYLPSLHQFMAWLDGYLARPGAPAMPDLQRLVRRKLALIERPLLWKLVVRLQRMRDRLLPRAA